jgi:hypothetical protein
MAFRWSYPLCAEENILEEVSHIILEINISFESDEDIF